MGRNRKRTIHGDGGWFQQRNGCATVGTAVGNARAVGSQGRQLEAAGRAVAYKSLAGRREGAVTTATNQRGPLSSQQNRLSCLATMAMVEGGTVRLKAGTAGDARGSRPLTIGQERRQWSGTVITELF